MVEIVFEIMSCSMMCDKSPLAVSCNSGLYCVTGILW